MTAVTYFYNTPEWWGRAHRQGCRDIRRESGGDATYDTDVPSLRALIEEMAHDFIFYNDMQPWTDYIADVGIAPCLSLPRETEGPTT
jgi:hypothetical protein